MNKQTIYVVTSGSYSDYTVHAVFTTQEKAQAFADFFNRPENREWREECEVETRPLDPSMEPFIAAGPRWSVVMGKDGTVHECEPYPVSTYNFDSCPLTADTILLPPSRKESPAIVTRCFADSQEHAIKITNEQRAQWIAEGKL